MHPEPNPAAAAATILDAALELAHETSWDAVRLGEVADRLEISLAHVHACYARKDDLAEALFDRADAAVFHLAPDRLAELDTRERLHTVIFAWLDALAPHRALLPAMLGYKLEPLHLHLQAQGVTRISRTVQWFMEAARIDTPNPRRALEEFGLTAVYLATFACWLRDDSRAQQRSREFLARLLARAGRLAGRG